MKKISTLLACMGFAASLVSADVIVSDSFNAADGTRLDTYGSWSGGGAALLIQDHTWGTWNGYDNASALDRGVSSTAGDEFARQSSLALGAGGFNDPSGQTFYFSFMFTKPDTADTVNFPGWANMVFHDSAATVTGDQSDSLFWQYSGSSQAIGSNEWGGGFDPPTNDGNQYLFVGRIDIDTDADATPNGDSLAMTGYGSVFAAGSDVSTLLANESNAGANYGFQQVRTSMNIDDTASLDTYTIRIARDSVMGNLRLGTTLQDVSIIPEPGTFALFGLAGLFLVARRRGLRG